MKYGKTMLALAATGLMALGMGVARADDATTPNVLSGPAVQGDQAKPQGPLAERRQEMADRLREAHKDLNLSEDQTTQVKKIFEDAKTAMRKFLTEHADELKPLRDQLKDAMEAKDRDKVRDLRQQIQKIMEDGPNGKALIDKIMAVLTDEQKAKLQAKIDEWKKEHPGAAQALKHRKEAKDSKTNNAGDGQ